MIVQKDKDELLVDVGGKSEGVLPFRELSLAIFDLKTLKVGESLEVMIDRILTKMDGTLFLSEGAHAPSRRGKSHRSPEHDEVYRSDCYAGSSRAACWLIYPCADSCPHRRFGCSGSA